MARLLFVLSMVTLTAACGDDDGTGMTGTDAGRDAGSGADAGTPDGGRPPRDHPAGDLPAVTEPETGIVREIVRLPGHVPPPNPEGGIATPAEMNVVQVVRWRTAGPMPEARAVIVAMPGFLGGAPSWEPLARSLVRWGAMGGEPIEVWAIDRRSNVLEDLAGMDAAEAAGDAEIAQGYYFGEDTVAGAAFPGFVPPEDVLYMSEWGMETHLEDLRRVIELVPDGKHRVFLMGHSFGGWMTEIYAAWRFADGTRGVEGLAGMIMVDASVGGAAITETEYHEGTMGGLTSLAGVDAIRAGAVYTELPILGLEVYPRAEIMALRALLIPDEVTPDRGRDSIFATLFGLASGRVPDMTNEAAMGLAFDDESALLSFAAISGGHSTGGPLETYTSLLGTELQRPSDPAATYSWVDALEADPREHTPVASLAHTWVDGRSNFAEWYFPTRLSLDARAIGDSQLAEDGWQAAEGLRAFDGALIDAPILVIAAALTRPPAYEPLRARVAPVIGPGRPAEGATRDTESAFFLFDAPTMTHIDPLTATDDDRNLVVETVAGFVYGHIETGTIPLPASL